MASLAEKAQSILEDKLAHLTPDNIKAGVTVLGVTGTYVGSTQYILQQKLDTTDLYGIDMVIRKSSASQQITDMDTNNEAQAGKLYLNAVKSTRDINSNIELISNIQGVNLLDFGCIDYETPKQLSSEATSLGGNYFILDKKVDSTFHYSTELKSGPYGGSDCNEAVCYEYNGLYLYVCFNGSYRNEIEMFTSDLPVKCTIS